MSKYVSGGPSPETLNGRMGYQLTINPPSPLLTQAKPLMSILKRIIYLREDTNSFLPFLMKSP